MRKLVVNADDFGLSRGINDGILLALRKGVVGSASLMANFPTSLHALELARTHQMDLGWHLNLTLGEPVAEKVPSLVRRDGSFYPLKQLIPRLFFRWVKREEVEREVESQWGIFEKNGFFPSHIDGHQHIHIFPLIRDVVREFVKSHRIPFVRVPREEGGLATPRPLARFLVNSFRGTKTSFWTPSRAKSLPFYGTSLVTNRGETLPWRGLVGRIREEIAELAVHPGLSYEGEDLHGDDYPGDREKLLEFLLHGPWQSFLREGDFSVAGFHELVSPIGHGEPNRTMNAHA